MARAICNVNRGMQLCVLAIFVVIGLTTVTAEGNTFTSSQRPRPAEKYYRCGGSPVVVEVLSENRSVAAYWGTAAYFGNPITETGTGPLSLELGDPLDGCAPFSGSKSTGGAVLVQRGECPFGDKAQNIENAGAALMLATNNSTGCLIMDVANEDTEGQPPSIWAAAVDMDVGNELRSLLANTSRVSVNVWAVRPGLDVSSAVLWLTAVLTVVLGSVWSAMDSTGKPRESSGTGGASMQDTVPTQILTEKTAALFIVMASAMLLLLFFLAGWFVMLMLVVLFAIISWQSLTVFLSPVIQAISPSTESASLHLPILGSTSVAEFIAGLVSFACTAIWAVFRNSPWAWLLQDLLGVSVCVMFLRTVQLPNLKVAMILLPLAFFYDVFWVFIQPMLTHSASVMVKVATGGNTQEAMPMVLRVPKFNSPFPGYSILGLGDIVLPGILVAFARTVDALKGRTLLRGYFAPLVSGYGLGLILTYLALMYRIGGQSGQPALLYLVPCTLCPMVALAAYRGELRQLMANRDSKANKQSDEEDGENIPRMDRGDSQRASLLA